MTGQARPETWLGDAVRALRALQPDDPTARSILALLGLQEAGPPQPIGAAKAQHIVAAVPALAMEAVTGAPAQAPPVRAAHVMPAPVAALPPVIEPEGRVAGKAGNPPRPLPPLEAVLPAGRPPSTVPTCLLPPGQQRAILSTLASRPARVGEIDVELLVTTIARRQPVTRLPRRPVNTTRHGLELLLDFGPGLRGFEQDRAEVGQVIANVSGADGLATLRFAGTPLDPPGAGPGPVWTWRPYRPPETPRPVLVVSDLGSRGQGHEGVDAVQRWARLARQLRHAGCSITALVPCPASRIAPELRSAISVVTWDRSANARDALAAVRRATSMVRVQDLG